MNKSGKSILDLAFNHKSDKRAFEKETFEKFVRLSKLNRELLEACPGIHDFSIEIPGKLPSQSKWECSICGGEVDNEAKIWYERGVKHGQLHSSG
jgi:hypothetical protein